jgi:hypothetical protein
MRCSRSTGPGLDNFGGLLDQMGRTWQADDAVTVPERKRTAPVEEQLLPTADDILAWALDKLDNGRRGLSDARDELNSDHRPLGAPLPAGHPKARSTALAAAL